MIIHYAACQPSRGVPDFLTSLASCCVFRVAERRVGMSRAFLKENDDQQSYLEWQKLLKDREELLRILEKKRKYLLEDPAAESIPEEKRQEMVAKYESEAEEVKRLLDEMRAEIRTP